MSIETDIKKPFVFEALISLLLATAGGAMQLFTLGGLPLVEFIIFVGGIGLGIFAIRKVKKTTGRGKVLAIIGIILGIMGLFNVVSGFIVENRINTMEQEGAREKTWEAWSAVQAYRKDKGQCPDNLEQLVPNYLSSTNILYDSKGKTLLQYKVSVDKENCEVFYGSSFGVGL